MNAIMHMVGKTFDRPRRASWKAWVPVALLATLAAAGWTWAQPDNVTRMRMLTNNGGILFSARPPAGGLASDVATPLDLRSCYTTPGSSLDNMNGFPAFHTVPRGYQTFDNIPLQIEGMINLWGKSNTESLNIVFPEQVTIPVSASFESLYVYHSSFFVSPDKSPVWQVVFHYANGSSITNQLLYGDDVMDWIVQPGQEERGPTGLHTRIAWKNGRFSPSQNKPLRFFLTEVQNPFPLDQVSEIDLQSCKNISAPCIMALTIGRAGLMR